MKISIKDRIRFLITKIRLFICRKFHIHIAKKEWIPSINLYAIPEKPFKGATLFKYKAKYCSLCQEKLEEEQIPHKLFDGYRKDSIYPKREYGNVKFEQSI